MTAPAAAAFFVLADHHGLDADALTDPATASVLAASALSDLDPWTGQQPQVRARALELVRPLRPLVAEVLADPRNAWWDAPVDRARQLRVTDRDVDPGIPTAPTGAGADSWWETYAQQPADHARRRTSTELPPAVGEPARSGVHAALGCWAGDWDPVYPLRQTRFRVPASARVHEIRSARDWHALCLRYADTANYAGPDTNLLDSAQLNHGPAPEWSRVAGDWDGVHLTFAGLLTALYVPVAASGVLTTLWTWEWESTLWLRPVLEEAEALPDLAELGSARAFRTELGSGRAFHVVGLWDDAAPG